MFVLFVGFVQDLLGVEFFGYNTFWCTNISEKKVTWKQEKDKQNHTKMLVWWIFSFNWKRTKKN